MKVLYCIKTSLFVGLITDQYFPWFDDWYKKTYPIFLFKIVKKSIQIEKFQNLF